MKVSDILKLVRSRGGIEEYPVRVYHGENLLWERLNESPVIPPTGVLRARYDSSDAQTLTTTTYQGDAVVTKWESSVSIPGVDTVLEQYNSDCKPKLTTLNGLQAIKFDGIDQHAGTPAIPQAASEYQAFKTDFEVSPALGGDLEAGLYVRYFLWNDRYTTSYDGTLARSADVVYYQHSTSDYWMVNPTATLGFNREGSLPPPQNPNWSPVQLHGGSHPTHYELPSVWRTPRIKTWTDQPPAAETYYLENRGWYFGSGEIVNHGIGDKLISKAGGSPLISTAGQQTKLNGMTVIILFQNDEDPDPYGNQPEYHTGVTDQILDDEAVIDGRGSIWFHKGPHINTHAPWEGQLYFDYRPGGANTRINSASSVERYLDKSPKRPKILVYQVDETNKKISVHFDGELYIEGDIAGSQQELTIKSNADFRLANAGWSQAATIGEVLVFDNNVDYKTRSITEGYLAHKWGIADKLPSWHLYKSATPSQQLLESSWTKV